MVKKLMIVMLALVSFLAAGGWADAEFWSTDKFQLGKIGWDIIPEIRVRNNLSELYYFQTYIGPAWNLTPALKMNIYYGFKEQKSGNDWKQSNLGYFDLTYAFKPFSNRSRLEIDATSSVVKYRDLFQLKINNMYLADEVFYNLTSAFVDENRLSAGYLFKPFGETELNLGYMIKNQRRGAGQPWTNTGAIVINSSTKI